MDEARPGSILGRLRRLERRRRYVVWGLIAAVGIASGVAAGLQVFEDGADLGDRDAVFVSFVEEERGRSLSLEEVEAFKEHGTHLDSVGTCGEFIAYLEEAFVDAEDPFEEGFILGAAIVEYSDGRALETRDECLTSN